MSLSCLHCGLAKPARFKLTSRNLQRRLTHTNSRFFRVSEEIQQALAERRPIVALESTIYTHGFPYPDNVALASRLESVVRTNGGVPATIGILDGVARVGLDPEELIRLVSSSGKENLLKVSRRDLSMACGLKSANDGPFNGGTTVSATMILAHLAGIKIFATGGLGGVHRGAESTMDISADLTELGRTPVAVISSGCKSFLDLPKTLEYLETQGVGVATFRDGRSGPVDFPAFYTRDSGLTSPVAIDSEADAASIIHAHGSLGLQSGLLLANPIPEQHSIAKASMDTAIDAALTEAYDAGISGAASTPYILAKIKDLTGSRSVEANRALVENNVRRGTIVAKELRKLEMDGERLKTHTVSHSKGSRSTYTKAVQPQHEDQYAGINQARSSGTARTPPPSLEDFLKDTAAPVQRAQEPSEEGPADIFVAGILAVDYSCDYAPRHSSAGRTPELHTSNPSRITQSLGGVGHNVARAAQLIGGNVRLCSAVGDDLSGKAALEALSAERMSSEVVKVFDSDHGLRTAQYIAVNDASKDLVMAMADMSILEQKPNTANAVAEAFDSFWLPKLRQAKPRHLVLDANWPPHFLARWLEAGKETGAYVSFEPVSNAKAAGLFHLPKTSELSAFPQPSVHLATPNAYELTAMNSAARDGGYFERSDWWAVIDALGIPSTGARTQLALATSPALVDRGIPQQAIQLLPFIPTILTKLGPQGVLLSQILPANDSRLTDGAYAPHILSRCNNGTESTLGVGGVYMRLFDAVEQVGEEDIVSVNGVGDTFAGTLIAGLASRGPEDRVEDLVDLAQRAAVLTLKSREAVSTGLGTLRILL